MPKNNNEINLDLSLLSSFFKLSQFSENYDNLKNELNKDQSKLISLLFFGIILGRVYEKFLMVKKSIIKRFK